MDTDRKVLIEILRHSGIISTPQNLFRSSFSNQFSVVKISGEKSELGQITCGVPQGSIIGPLLFLIYKINWTIIINWTLQLYGWCGNFYNKRNQAGLEPYVNNNLSHLTTWFRINKIAIYLIDYTLFTFPQEQKIST